MRSRRLIAALLACCALSWGDARAATEWTDQLLAGIAEFALTDSAVQVDAAARPHVFVGGDLVYHYWLDAGVWHSEIVDSHARSGERLRSAIGPSGEFHLVYVRSERTDGENPLRISPPNAPERSLYYATNLSGAWVVEKIANAPAGAAVSGLAVDASHVPHVLADGAGTSPSHGSRAGGHWSFETIDASGGSSGGSPPDAFTGSLLAADATGSLHAVWFPADPYAPGAIYSRRDGAGWHTELLLEVAGKTVAPTRYLSTLLLDADGEPHLLAPHGTGGILQDVHHTPAGWAMDVFASGAQAFTGAMDAQGQLHVLTLTPAPEDGFLQVNHLSKTGSIWGSEVALGSIPASQYPYVRFALAADSDGDLHGAVLISNLFGEPDAPLTYLRRDSAWSSVEIARTIRSGEENASLGADVRLGLVGSSRRLLYRAGPSNRAGTTGPVYHAVEGPAGFTVESLPKGPGCWPETNSLELGLDPLGGERAFWICGGANESVRAGDGTWSTFTPSDEFGVEWLRPGLVFDAQGRLHAAFGGYVSQVGGVLHTIDTDHRVVEELIQGEGLGDNELWQHPGNVAIALGPLGSATIAALGPGRGVWVGTNASGQWVGSVVGAPLPPGEIEGYALAVTGDGVVHIAYENKSDGFDPHPTLWYGTNQCDGEFYAREIDPLTATEGPAPNTRLVGSRNPDIALDSVGNPHISYRRQADHSLGYAHIQGGAWVTETVVGDTSSGEKSAIAIDGAGTVSIAHHDDWAGDLHLATRAPLEPEPHWDGCPPLPDPNALRSGSFIFAPPAAAVPVYDPTAPSVQAEYGEVDLELFVYASPSGQLYIDGSGDIPGGGPFDLGVRGKGSLKGKRGRIGLKEVLVARDEGTRLKIVREESIDAATLQRSTRARMTGTLQGRKVKLDQTSMDTLPESALFPLRLELQTSSGKKGALVASAIWRRSGQSDIELTGKGKWSPATETADLTLKAKGVSIKLAGLRIWKSRADGIHLSAARISGKAFGQKLDADLSGAF